MNMNTAVHANRSIYMSINTNQVHTYMEIQRIYVYNIYTYIYIYGTPTPSYLPFLGEVEEVFRVQG